MQAHSAQAIDDIATVLGRFQAWSGSREPAAKDGVREISYEQALESSRYRWKKYGETAPTPQKEQDLRAEPGVVPIASSQIAPNPEADPEADPEGRPEAALEDADAPAVGAPTSEASRRTAASARKTPRRKQQFHAIIAQSAAGGAPGISLGDSLARSWVGEERQVSMSLRVAASEQALIKVRAAEAGVSASAYLRQCALEVEILRAQVQQFLAVSARTRTAELGDGSRAAAPVRKERWLVRIKHRIWGTRDDQSSLKT